MSEGPGKPQDAYRTISEVSEHLQLPQHVLRFWESKFSQIKPLKRSGNRRYYRPQDMEILSAIQRLLHDEGYTIRGVQKLFKDNGLRTTVSQVLAGAVVGTGSVESAHEKTSEITSEITADTHAFVLSLEDKEKLLDTLKNLQALRDRLG